MKLISCILYRIGNSHKSKEVIKIPGEIGRSLYSEILLIMYLSAASIFCQTENIVFNILRCLNQYCYLSNLHIDNIVTLSTNYRSSQPGETLVALKSPSDPEGNIDIVHLMVPSPNIL